MLNTYYCYKDIDSCWDDEVGKKGRRRIKECCTEPDPEKPSGDCCYNSWDAELKQVSQQYMAAVEYSEQLKKNLAFVTDRRDRFRTWVLELDKAEDKARLICSQLEILATHTRKIWYNSCLAVQATEILFCMITDFLFQVDGLRKQYDELMNCVNNNHDPAIGKGTGILKYAEDYLAKLEAVIKTRDDLVKPAMEAIRIANLIRNSISSKECPAPPPENKSGEKYDPCNDKDALCPECWDEEYYGLKSIVCEWYQELNCAETCIEINTAIDQPQIENLKQKKEAELKALEDKRKKGLTAEELKKWPQFCYLYPDFYFPI